MCCGKCSKGLGALIVLFGIAFLLQDLGIFAFWGINWWTIGFLIAGLGMFCSSCCKACQGVSCCDETKCCEKPAETKPVEVKAPVAAPVTAPSHKKK